MGSRSSLTTAKPQNPPESTEKSLRGTEAKWQLGERTWSREDRERGSLCFQPLLRMQTGAKSTFTTTRTKQQTTYKIIICLNPTRKPGLQDNQTNAKPREPSRRKTSHNLGIRLYERGRRGKFPETESRLLFAKSWGPGAGRVTCRGCGCPFGLAPMFCNETEVMVEENQRCIKCPRTVYCTVVHSTSVF